MSERVISRGSVVTAAIALATLALAAAAPARDVRCPPRAERLLASPSGAWLAQATRSVTAFRAPGMHPFARFGVRNVNGAATIFGVIGERLGDVCRPVWVHVALPMRPNGITGWVPAAKVRITKVHTRIVVDVSQRSVRLYKWGRLVLRSRAAVGSSATPTPVGRFYVNQKLVPSDPGGPFGPGAVGISAFSPVLTGWAQGGPIAIHGTNEPWSIGRAVSNGCIRLPNSVLRRLFSQARVGTPVLIRR
jgi:lipoprotein-anchoring transpeptidase ErfK/SrfK